MTSNDTSSGKIILTPKQAQSLLMAVGDEWFNDTIQHNGKHLIDVLIDESVKDGKLKLATLLGNVNDALVDLHKGKVKSIYLIDYYKLNDGVKKEDLNFSAVNIPNTTDIESELREAANNTKFEEPVKEIIERVHKIREVIHEIGGDKVIDWNASLKVIQEERKKHPSLLTMAERLGEWNKKQQSSSEPAR